MAQAPQQSVVADALRTVVSLVAIGVGLFLVFGSTTEPLSDGVFVGTIALVLAVWLWPGVTVARARVVSLVLALLAAYALIRGFGLLELSVLRQLGGILAIVTGVILLLPLVRGWLAKRSDNAAS